MKPIIKKLWLLIAMLWATLSALAYDFEVDGIYYNILSLEELTCEVTYNAERQSTSNREFYNMDRTHRSSIYKTYPSYSGEVTIPSKVIYKGRELSVIGIGEYAFLDCTGLKSLSLPSSITQIKEVLIDSYYNCFAGAFDYCHIESLTVGNAYTLKMFNRSYAYSSGCMTKDNLRNFVLEEDFSGVIDVNFNEYKKLASIKSNAMDVPVFSDGLHFSNNQFLNILITVPSSYIQKYKIANIWSKFWDIFVIEDMMTPSNTLGSYDFEVDGIYYNILSLEELTCEVTYNAERQSTSNREFYNMDRTHRSSIYKTYPSYSGEVTIPSKVIYKGRELSVIGIGEYAFLDCTGLKSLSLPSSITQIKEVLIDSYYNCFAGAFDYCHIESLTVGNAYTLKMFSRSYAYSSGCMTKDNLKNLVLEEDFSGVIDVNFSEYKKLASIRSNAVDVPAFSEGSHFSNDQYLNEEVLVPEKSFTSYQSADVWKSFWDLKAMKSVTSITLNETSISLEPNQTIQLVPTLLPEDAFDVTVKWGSSNPEVASVDSNGLVTAISKGDAVISVSSTDGSDITAQCSVHVDLLVKEIILSESEIGLEPGESKKLDVTIKPEEAFVKNIIWTSDADNVASVDEDGKVVAINIGVANISVQTTDGSDLKATCKVTVAELVKSITITPNEAAIKEGETLQLTYSVFPETAAYKDVVWESENNDVASVDANGTVTAISSGLAKIKAIATDGSNVYGECSITVTAETKVVDDVCYQRNSLSTLKIVANSENPYSGNFFIPACAIFEGQEMKVTEIGTDAFAGCENLSRLVIPNTITKIGDTAFANCSNLIYVKIEEGSSLSINLDTVFPDSPINELFVGSNGITYDSESKLLGIIKGMTLSGNVTTFPPAEAFQSLECFIVENGSLPMIEPEDYCSRSQILINQQTIRDPYTYIYYRFFFLVTYTHLSPILEGMENGTLNYVHIDREVQGVGVDTSIAQQIIPTSAGDRYQEFGYKDECNYSYQELMAKRDYDRNPIENISFEEPMLELEVGKSIYPIVVFKPTNASFKKLAWSSSDDSIATVDMFGNVTKISSGEAEITATTTDGTNLSTRCKIVDAGAGTDNVSLEDNGVRITAKDGLICVVGYEDNQPIEIYEISGRLILTSLEDVIRLNSRGIFIVKAGETVGKVIL